MADMFKTTMLEKALDAAVLRQQVISNNIANVNTTGYRPATVAFEAQLKKALEGQDGGDLQPVSDEEQDPNYIPVDSGQSLNSVQAQVMQMPGKMDMNKEMVNLAKNQILYNALVQKISGTFAGIKYVIDNSGR